MIDRGIKNSHMCQRRAKVRIGFIPADARQGHRYGRAICSKNVPL